jgi:hypothetical protein
MKTRIITESFDALSFGISIRELRTNKADCETQSPPTHLLAPPHESHEGNVATGEAIQLPVSIPTTGQVKALKIVCEVPGAFEPLVLECWLVKQQLAPGSTSCFLAPPVDLPSLVPGGFSFYEAANENQSAGH